MAADQLKKRSNASSVVGYTSREHHKVKKKKVDAPHNDLNMSFSVSLEWDDKKKSVVAKREQIGIARRELIQFLDFIPHCHDILADVFTTPREIFELVNLTDVLSYEVWQSHLSEKERKFLSQFLPRGTEVHKVVQELLAGDNFHFGNPFLEWGASVCSRSCHPDAILRQELCFKANKKAYYSELQTYHNTMIGNLQTWKERWVTCKDSEHEFMQKIWRLRKDSEKHGSVHAVESRFCDPDENLGATSESGSWLADEKACSSESPNLTKMHGETRRNSFIKNKYHESSDGHKKVARHQKGAKVLERNIECDDGAKYMSYIKVSKEQHQLIKSSMKPSSNSIQRRSLNHVLGSINTFCVQPYEVFEEEERQKLHAHWYELANRDLPAVFETRRKWQLEKRQLTMSLGQEIKDKLSSLKEDEEEEKNHKLAHLEMKTVKSDFGDLVAMELDGQGEEKERSEGLQHEQKAVGATNHDPSVTSEDEENVSSDFIFHHQADNGAANDERAMEDEVDDGAAENQHLRQIALRGDSPDFRPLDVDSGNNQVLGKDDDFSHNVSMYPENMNHIDVPVNRGESLSSAGGLWAVGRLPSAYYQHPTPVSREYRSASELSLGHLQAMPEQPTQVIDLESDMQAQDPRRDFMQRQSCGDESFFSPYPNQDRNELLLQSLFKSPGSLPYQHEQKQPGSDFHPTASNVMLESVSFAGNMQELPSGLELRQKRMSDLYLHQNIPSNIQESIFADGNSIPRREHFTPINNIQDWAAVNGNINISASSHSHLNGGEILHQSWFSGENRPRDGWSASEGAVGGNRIFENGSNSADQSLFSVLSQCNGLRSGAHYASMGNSDCIVQHGNFGGMSGGPVPGSGNVLQQTAHPLNNYLNGHEASAGLRANSVGWMSLPQQNNGLQDSMGKTFLRPWNH